MSLYATEVHLLCPENGVCPVNKSDGTNKYMCCNMRIILHKVIAILVFQVAVTNCSLDKNP